jgi:hypothetical protein
MVLKKPSRVTANIHFLKYDLIETTDQNDDDGIAMISLFFK